MNNVYSFRPRNPNGGNGGGGGEELETRIARLEVITEIIRDDLKDIKLDMRNITSDVTQIKVGMQTSASSLSDISSRMITKLQLTLWALIGLAFVVSTTFGAAWWAAQQFVAPILSKITAS